MMNSDKNKVHSLFEEKDFMELYDKEVEQFFKENTELDEEYKEEDMPWELIDDIEGLSDMLSEENVEEFFDEEYPGLYRIKKDKK